MAENLIDGTVDFSLGQDAWHFPDKIQPNQYAAGVNISNRGGEITPRLPFHQLALTFDGDTLINDLGHPRTMKSLWTGGKAQAFIPYSIGFDDYLLTVISGLIFQTNVKTGKTILLSTEIKLNQYASRINWSYAEKWIVLFDFPDYPILISDEGVERSKPDQIVAGFLQPGVPISVLGTYNHNRLFIANDGIELTAGDPIGNRLTPDAPVTFAEVFNPSSPFVNQFLSLPIEQANSSIVAMGFIQEVDSSTGIGPLFVATDKNFYFYRTDQPREAWGQSEGFGGVLLVNRGVAGPRAFVNVNSDLIFLSDNYKVYALSAARNEIKRWGNVPISREIENYLKCHDETLRRFGVLGYFNNRIFISTNPYRVESTDRNERPVTDYAHGGFVVIEVDNLASFLSEGTPVWAGLWTGVNPVDFGTIRDRCFVLSKDGCNTEGAVNAIYEIKEDSTVDVVKGKEKQIRSILYSRLYNFKNPLEQKTEHTISLGVQELEGKIKVDVDRRPSHAHKWLRVASWEHDAPVEQEEMPEDEFINGFSSQSLKRITFGDPEEGGCSPLNQDEYSSFLETQLRITLQGDYWRLKNIKLTATPHPVPDRMSNEICNKLPAVKVPADPLPDWKITEGDICQL